MTLREFARLQGLTRQRIHILLQKGRIKGARKKPNPSVACGWVWEIPAKARIAPPNSA